MAGSDQETAAAIGPARHLQRDRARVACWRCHKKKIRCNASGTLPCSGCVQAGLDCVLIDSRRGRYARKRQGINHNERPMPKRRSVDDEAADIDGNTATGGSYAYSHPGSYNVAGSNHGASTAQPNPPRRVASSSSLLPPNFLPPRPAWSSRTALSSTHSSPNIDESPEMFYAQIAERSVLANDDPIHPTGQSVFLGEAFSLTYVVHEVLAPHLSDSLHYKKRLHFPITDAATRRPRSFYVRDDTVANQVELLKRQGLFYRPPSEALQKLLDAYFEYFHPAYPLIERARFADALQAEQQSHLALNALLMIAVTLCDAETLEAVGCGDRHTARSTFFKQARILYDLDAERDKMNIIVGVFLMSFWWGGPNDQKDSWHWLGISLGLAQSLGLHRTTTNSNIDSRTARRWRLIWWSMRIRDILVSGSIGRPQHVYINDCDVELPEAEDVIENLGHQGRDEVNYFSQVARLCAIISRIITSRYASPRADRLTDDQESLENALARFNEDVPASLRYRGIGPDFEDGLWPSMLTMAYNYAILLLCRPAQPHGEHQKWGNKFKALAAASVVTRTMEDILAVSMVRLCQVHTRKALASVPPFGFLKYFLRIPALFNALALHVYSICNSNAIGRELAETRAKVCMLGLSLMEESWPVGGWVLKLFVSIMERLKQQTPQPPLPPAGRTMTRNKSRHDSFTETEKGLTTDPRLPEFAASAHSGAPAGSSNNQSFSPSSTAATREHDLAAGSQYDDFNLHPKQTSPDQLFSGQRYSTTNPPPLLPSIGTDDYPHHHHDDDNLMPNIFAFDDSLTGGLSDQDNFFQSLELAHLQDSSQNLRSF